MGPGQTLAIPVNRMSPARIWLDEFICKPVKCGVMAALLNCMTHPAALTIRT